MVRAGNKTRITEKKQKLQGLAGVNAVPFRVSVLARFFFYFYDFSDSVHADCPQMAAQYFLLRTLRTVHCAVASVRDQQSNLWNASLYVSEYHSTIKKNFPH
jgi:hypothetical protein